MKSFFMKKFFRSFRVRIAVLALLALAFEPIPQASAQSIDVYGTTSVAQILSPVSMAATTTTVGTNLSQFVGQVSVVLSSTNTAGTSPTMTVKLQQSADNSNFADIAGATFPVVNTIGTNCIIGLDTTAFNGSNYVRAVLTQGGSASPINVSSIYVIGRKHYN